MEKLSRIKLSTLQKQKTKEDYFLADQMHIVMKWLNCPVFYFYAQCTRPESTMLGALTVASLILWASASDLCPPPCMCLHNLTVIMCTDKHLDWIPVLPEDTKELYISYNKIQEMRRGGLEHLQVQNIQ